MTVPELRVLIVSPNPLARGGLTSLVAGMIGVKAVGAVGIVEAASLAGQLLPDAVLLDAGDGEPEDLDGVARLAAAQPGLPIVALASDQSAIAQALAFGASALLPAGIDAETLAAALLASARGLATIPRRDLALLLPEEERIDPAVKAPTETLTPRELEVLQLMARGLTNRQIARRLEISEHTVKFHAAAILGKLSARSRAEAVARAIGLGWILV
ncbi:MAG TPA: response regulator transcription factor [Candidatus Dormibacteraeota bacterium]|nr:response regulator transcription factor [Candidatus Dormibacteraeota bacterium]